MVLSLSLCNWRDRWIAGGSINGYYGWIVAARILMEMRNISDNIEASITPEMALDETNVMYSNQWFKY